MDNKLITRLTYLSPFGFTTSSEETFRFYINHEYDYLEEDFNIFGDVAIPKGRYTWWYYDASFETNPSRTFSVDLSSQWGDFYNGTKTSYNTGLNYKVNRYIGFSTDMEFNNITAGSISFDTKEYGLRINTNISPRLTSRSYIQWNNETKEVNLNFRIHYIPQIGSNVYFVYNHIADGNRDYKTKYYTGIAKISYLVKF